MRHLPEPPDPDPIPGRDPRWRLLLLLIARSPAARVLGALVVSASLGAALYATHLYTQAVSPSCDEIPIVDLDIPEIVALKNRVESYQKDPYEGATLSMSADEFNFILRDRDHAYQAHVRLEGDQAIVHAAMPREDGTCYNIRYVGSVDVQDGVATLHPERLRVGEADITGWVDGEDGLRMPAEQMPDPLSREQLGNLESMKVQDGQIVLRLVDRWAMW